MKTFGTGGVRAAIAALLAGWAAAVLAWSGACAAEPTVRDALLRNQIVHEAALYETEEGGRVFVLDRTREPPLMQYRGSEEVFALSRVPAARGDEILRADTGEDLVRITALGGVTLYPRDHRTGLPAARIGPADPLPLLDAQSLDMGAALARLKNAIGGGTQIETPALAASAGGSSSTLIADAARVTAAALARAASDPAIQAKLGDVRQVLFVYGAGPGARFEGGVLLVEIDPSGGYAGRPSSMRVADALRDGG